MTHDFLCPNFGRFLFIFIRLAEVRPDPAHRRCLVECAAGRRYVAAYPG